MKKILLVIMVLFATFACSKEKDYVLGNIDGKEITAKDFRKNLINQYGFNKDDLKLEAVRSFFRDFYTTYIFAKEGELVQFFSQEDFQKRAERRKATFLKQQLDRKLGTELLSQIKLEDKDFESFVKKVKVRHILSIFGEKANNPFLARKIALDKIEQIKKEVNPKNFAELAQKYSEDPGSKDKGGDVGWVDANTPFVAPFKDAALSAKIGEVVGPVETEYGFHLLLIEEEQKRPVDEVKKDQKIKEGLEKSKARNLAVKFMEDLRVKYKDKIHYYPERMQNVEKFKNEDLYRVDGADGMTVGEAAKLMGPALKQYQKDMTEVTNAIQNKLIDSDLRYLESVSKGYDKDPDLVKKNEYDIITFKGHVYQSALRQMISSKVEKGITEAEIKVFYQHNQNQYKDGKNTVPYEKAKQWIKSDLLAQKVQEEMGKIQMELFKKYKIEFKD